MASVVFGTIAAPALAQASSENQPSSAVAPAVVAPAPATEPAPAPAAAPGATPDADVSLALPDPERAMAAMRYLEARVRGDDAATPPAARPDRPIERGASIVLRLRGKVVGRGESFTSPTPLIAAADEAIATMRAIMPTGVDALQQRALAADLVNVQISLELAGPLIPIIASTFAEADTVLSPGRDGVALRLGNATLHATPALMLERNQTAGPMLAALISQATGDATAAIPGTIQGELGANLRTRSAAAYRFRVVHVAHATPGEPAIFLSRGGRHFAPTRLDGKELAQWADGMALHIASRWRAPERANADGAATARPRLLGIIFPMQGRADPDDATAPERALSAIALARYASTNAANAGEARRVAREIIDQLAPDFAPIANEAAPPLTLAPNAAGLTIEAIRLLNDPAMPGRAGRLARLTERVRTGFEKGTWSRAAPLPTRGSIVLGLAAASRLAEVDAPDQAAALRNEASEALGLIYTSTPPGVLVTHMPWLLTAELLLAQPAPGQEPPAIPASPALRDVRDQVNRHMMTASDAGDEPDLAGGIVFTQGRASLPTWFGARPLAGNAIMLGDPRLTTSEERLKELSHLLEGLRFLRQLTIDEDWMWGVTSPEEVRWGVRISLWDQRQPIDASAMTLLAVVETMESLRRAGTK